jgi:crotonobetainyl-CoA:carnitine CoA-transferase CaiB-like acyl-CoA transferase
MLADQGADVIKLESPGGGDLTRQRGNSARVSAGFVMINRNKRSIAIDLKQPAGVELAQRLVRTADLFVENFRPGAADRIGLGEPALRALKPDLIYVSINGFGESGPYSHRRAYDPVIQAASGAAAIQGDRVTGRPHMVRIIISDKVTALTAAQAMTAALFSRERTGKGQHIKLAMLDAVVSFLWPEEMDNYALPDSTRFVKPNVLDLVYETEDGYITAAVVSTGEWRALCHTLGHPEWIEDPRFLTPGDRVVNADERFKLIGDVLAHGKSEEWIAKLEAAQVPCAIVNSREDVLTDPQVKFNELLVEYQHPAAGRVRQTRPAARFEGTPQEIRRPAPMLGEHTEEVLSDLGVAAAEIAALREARVIL